MMFIDISKNDAGNDFEEACKKYNIKPTEKSWKNARDAFSELEICVEFEWDTDTGDCKVIKSTCVNA